MPNPEATKFYVRHREGYPEDPQDSARRGFWMMGVELAPFEWVDDINDLTDLGPTVGVAGYIGDVHRALQKMELPIPENVDYPNELKEYLGRNIRLGTLAEVTRSSTRVFMKPVEHKAFTGFVWENDALSRRKIMFHELDTPVWISDLVDIVAEYRSFILRGEILDCRLYKGDWSKAPSRSVVEAATAKIVPFTPVAFCLDWGVTASGETILIEMNEGYAFGPYGLLPGYHAHMLSARWFEMCGGSTR
jgi:hypothetical protein